MVWRMLEGKALLPVSSKDVCSAAGLGKQLAYLNVQQEGW